MRYLGEFENTAPATRKLVSRLAEKYDHLHFCYAQRGSPRVEGPTGYGLYRQIQDQDCAVVTPLLIPKRSGERINRRDAVSLARLHRAGELTAVWVPDPATRRCAICPGHVRRPWRICAVSASR